MTKIYYEVHSDADENNLFCSFEGKDARQNALSYAKDHKDELTWVDKVIYNEDYEYVGAIWNYYDEED